MTSPTKTATKSPGESPMAPEKTPEKDTTPGSPWWWLDYLTRKLMARQNRFDVLEDYAVGNHPLPNPDRRYARALREIQQKSRTNYCELVIKATTERMKVKGFRFGPEGEADPRAKEIWDANKMDLLQIIATSNAATFGLTYGLVQGPDEQSKDPYICIENPRQCVVERDPIRYTRTVAGLKLWQDRILECVMAVLYLPDLIYVFKGKGISNLTDEELAALTRQISQNPNAAGFELLAVQTNKLKKVPLVEGSWQPEYGPLSRAEHEGVLDIQDRINHTVLDRMVITKSQAYRQRWVSGVKVKQQKGRGQKPPWDPGADMLWVTDNADAKFGDFEQADITQILMAVKDDVGDMAAISQTPATYLMNRMANVSGDTLTQDQSALISKIKGHRHVTMGYFYEELIQMAMDYTGDGKPPTDESPDPKSEKPPAQDGGGKPAQSPPKGKDTPPDPKDDPSQKESKSYQESKQEHSDRFPQKDKPAAPKDEKPKGPERLQTLWHSPEIRSYAEQADAFGKLVSAGVPVDIASELILDLTPDQIAYVMQAAEKAKADEALQAQKLAEQSNQHAGMQADQAHKNGMQAADQQNQHAIQQIKAKPKPSAAPK